jgi:hypothetical protein
VTWLLRQGYQAGHSPLSESQELFLGVDVETIIAAARIDVVGACEDSWAASPTDGGRRFV